MTTGMMRDGAAELRIDFFPVRSVAHDEIVLGEDDAHLGFRVSFLRRPSAGGVEVVATTVVHVRNAFGRAYIAVISPFHRIVVRASLRCLAEVRADP